MSVPMIQKKSGRRARVARFVRGELRLINAALEAWSVRNGFAPSGGGMGAAIRAELRERNASRGTAQ